MRYSETHRFDQGETAMLVGVPKEIKKQESRVGLTPSGVRELVALGHEVVIETTAGVDIGLTDELYLQAGASVADSAKTVFETSDLIVKVKEPQEEECRQLREGQLLFTYLHLAPDPLQTRLLIESGVTAIAYETVTSPAGTLPLLTPMSEVAGRMSIQAGAWCLEKSHGGNGVLLGGVPGVAPACVLVLGGGVVGLNAARMAAGLGADVTIFDRNLSRLQQIDELFGDRIKTLFSTTSAIEQRLPLADLVVGAVLIPGAAAPKLVTRSQLKLMKPGSVLVDVAIDQGGCFETSKPTTHEDPVFVVEGINHYCVANMPGGVAYTSTYALTNATMPYVLRLANAGCEALLEDPHFLEGLNVHKGKITNAPVAKAYGVAYVPPAKALAN